MALSEKTLNEIISNLDPEDREALHRQLGKFLENPDTITNQPTPTAPPVTKPASKEEDSNFYCCVKCGSANFKKNGFSTCGVQRYFCKDCRKSWQENEGVAMKWSHLSQEQWIELLTGYVNCHSINKIHKDTGISGCSIWLNMIKTFLAIKHMYGYDEVFTGVCEADEAYMSVSFKGKRDPYFFIYGLGRMPRHHRSREEKIAYLQDAGLYDKLLEEEPSFLEELLEDEKKKRGISNDQVCILTIVDDSGHLYLEPVSVGRLEKAMAKAKVKPKAGRDGNVLVTDEHKAYKNSLYGTGAKHEAINASEYKKRKYNLAKVNSVHSELARFMNNINGKLPATKYLDLYLIFFWWLYKYKDYSTKEKVQMLYNIMTDNITDLEAKARVDQITGKEIYSRELTLDTKGQFPTRV